MWFHRSCRADDWLLFVVSVIYLRLFAYFVVFLPSLVKDTWITSNFSQIASPVAHNGHGFVSGEMFNRNGEVLPKVIMVLHFFLFLFIS